MPSIRRAQGSKDTLSSGFIQASRIRILIGNFSLTYHAGHFMRKSDHSEERRAARRFEVTWAVVIKGKGRAGERLDETGTLQNLSSRGAFFLMPRPVQPGARLEIEIQVPMKEESWMKYSAKVVRVRRHEASFGVAVKFPTARPTFIER
jgi:hypothetical protein